MFAGLPGIGVGTLFYILISFSMPFRELPRVFQGTSSLNTWKNILRQMFYSVGIIISVMFAERLMLWVLDWVTAFDASTFSQVVGYISVVTHFESFAKGVIDLKDVVYYISMIVLGLFLTARSMDSMRWRA